MDPNRSCRCAGTCDISHWFAVSDNHCTQCPSSKRVEVGSIEHFESDEAIDFVVHAVVVHLTGSKVEVCDLSDTVVIVEEFGIGGSRSHVLDFVSDASRCLNLETFRPCLDWGQCSSARILVDIPFRESIPQLYAHDCICRVLKHDFGIA